jgi:hypothetical protein
MEKIFKAKSIDNGEWIEFDILKDNLNHYKSDGGVYEKDKVVREFTSLQKRFSNYEIDKNTVCQYTGINDSKHNKIFEGDESTDEKGKKCIVFFNDRTQQTCIKYYDGSEFAARSYVLEGLTLTGHNIHDKD